MNPIITKILSKSWELVKPHVFPMLLVLVVTFAAFKLYRRDLSNISERLNQMQLIHDEELKKVRDIYTEERREHEENLKKLQAALEDVEKKHDEDIKALDEKKSKTVKKLVETYKDDAKGMTEQVSKATGFPVYVPVQP